MSDTPRNKLSLKREATSEQFKLEERLHKVLAQAGLGSRRALEQRIAEGLVKVNGEVAQTACRSRAATRSNWMAAASSPPPWPEPSRVLVYNKPEGEVTTRDDPEGRPTVFESLPPLKGARWIAIGRLDINTTGLLLATTDGELGQRHDAPVVRGRARVRGARACAGSEEKVSDAIVDRLTRGVLALEDGPAKFDEIERIGGTDSHDWFRVVVKEGRNREVRRLWESQGCQVSRLKRTRYGKVSLPRELARGHSVELGTAQVEALRAQLKLEEGRTVALTLQPVIGQRRAAKTTVRVREGGRGNAYVNGHNTADEGRELRRFDNVREDRGRGRGGKGWRLQGRPDGQR
ncbi:pseudouridine synthase [Stenotrophomonas sp. NRRL B-14846]|uniref:pseudouridine synthase n=1 Tax=Stenotrophomonas sp. NRRL B-14846 TaxID=3162882 RepID=UPI003D2C7275